MHIVSEEIEVVGCVLVTFCPAVGGFYEPSTVRATGFRTHAGKLHSAKGIFHGDTSVVFGSRDGELLQKFQFRYGKQLHQGGVGEVQKDAVLGDGGVLGHHQPAHGARVAGDVQGLMDVQLPGAQGLPLFVGHGGVVA